ncbi:MAG: polysaccharide biosynthesis C-terminal domain-containing protein [Bacteroidota bacterium]
MTGIAFSVLSQAWKDKNLVKVLSVYKKTALNLLIAGFAMMGLLILNIDNIIVFLGPRYESMIQVVLILGFSKLIDLGTGLNSHLLLTSKHWRIEFFTNIFLVIMAGVFNYLLVRRYGIIGSAWATFIAFSVYNSVRFFLIWKLFKMQPFDMNNVKIIIIALLSFFAVKIIPAIPNLYLDVLMRSILFTGLYGFILLRLTISKDVNDFFKIAVTRLISFLKL